MSDYLLTVKANIPGAGVLQSPIVACLYRAYPVSLSSLLGEVAGCQVRTNSAVSSNFFYEINLFSLSLPEDQTWLAHGKQKSGVFIHRNETPQHRLGLIYFSKSVEGLGISV